MNHIRQAVADNFSNRTSWELIDLDDEFIKAEAHALIKQARLRPVQDWSDWEINLATRVKAGQNTFVKRELRASRRHAAIV